MAKDWQSKLTDSIWLHYSVGAISPGTLLITEVLMNRFKSLTFVAIFLLCLSASGLADGAPASQFGFKGWPYLQHPVCSPAASVRPSQTPAPASRPTARPGHTPDPGSPSTSGDVGDYTTLSVSAQEYSAWNLINADRESNGLASLPLDETLCALARIKSCDMKNEKYFSHTSPPSARRRIC